jgi:glyoxylase-like metal-dependent hydrolase (beta-lactamase superfamily II)
MLMRTAIPARVGLSLLASVGLWVAWSQNQPQPLTMEKLSDSLYVIFGSGGNVAVMPTSEGVILVDDKFAQNAPEIMAKVKSVTDKPIRYVLNTHQHGDHTGGNEAMMAANAEVIIHRNARANMAAGKMPGLPRITFADQSEVFLGGKQVVAHHFGRGHTNGDSVIYFPAERTVHMGDLFVNGAPFCDTSANCSIKEWDKTIEKALQLDAQTVIPGHGPVMKRADLQKWVKTLGAVRERIRKACSGGPAEEAIKRLDLKDLGMEPSALFARGMPGMCKELAQ